MNRKQGNNRGKTYILLLLAGVCVCVSCQKPKYTVSKIEGHLVEIDATFDQHPDEATSAILDSYKEHVDSLVGIVIGYNEKELTAYRPESLLANMTADALQKVAADYSAAPIDLAIINVGGLRASIAKGNITLGNIFETFPFENYLCLITLDGKTLLKLFGQLAALRGEGISGGVRLVVSRGGKLKEATVNGQKVDEERLYVIATVDYLAEGNDGMDAFLEAKEKAFFPDATLRLMMVNYISGETNAGRTITSSIDGRFKIE